MLESINSRLPDGVRVSPLTVTFKTSRGGELLKKVAQPKRLWRKYHSVGALFFLLLGVLSTFAMLNSAAGALINTPEPTGVNNPKNAVLAPGVNEMMPFAAVGYILGALMVAMIVHEAGHAISAKVSGEEFKETGIILLLFVPIAAYVKVEHPDDEFDRMRMFAAGVMNNLVVTGASVAGFALIPASLYEMWQVYVTSISGGLTPTAQTVAQYSPAANFLFWLLFINVNLAAINTLPIFGLDGGHYLKAAVEMASRNRSYLEGMSKKVVAGVSIIMAASLALSIFGPAVLN